MISFETVIITILIFIIILTKQSLQENPKRILNVYAQRGKWYWLKFSAIGFILILRRLKCYLYGKSQIHKIEDMEKIQPLSTHEHAFDAVFFQAVTQDGIYFSSGTERRHGGKIVGLVYIVHPEYGLLESEELPNTIMDASVSSLYNQDHYSGGGISFTLVEPMKKWKVAYKGFMHVQNNPRKLVEVNFEAEYTSEYDWFFVDVDVPVPTLARAIATEPWSKQLFQNLINSHQSHYEQMGYVNGMLKINGEPTPIVKAGSFRDHSFGHKRDWSIMHRYIYSMFFLSDRTKITLGVISQPCSISHIALGYVNQPDGRLDPVDSSNLILYENAENGDLPKELKFSFVAKGVTYEVQMEFLYDGKHYKGNNQEAVIIERFNKCVINGVPGRGISDWHYNKNILK